MCIICDNTYSLSEKQRIQLNRELNIEGIVDKVINQLYDDRKVDDKTMHENFVSHYEPLKKAVEEGYGKPLIKVEYGTPNYEFLKALQTNTAVFSMFKNHASVKDMAALLKDREGNLRSRDDFKREALKVDSTYRSSKLDIEYDTAVRQARMAANWQRYEKNKRLYPNLKYIQTKAAKPDEQHLKYVGIIRPVDDPFWNSHYPPNRWRCQCSVEQTDDEPTDIPAKLPPVPDDFAFNSGKMQQVFEIEKSEYIKAVPPAEQPALIREAKKHVVKDAIENVPYQQLYKSKKGGSVEAHPVTFDNTDFNQVLKLARQLANEGHNVKMLPDVNDSDLRKKLLTHSGIKENKNPDFIINDKIVADAKTIMGSTKNTIAHSMSAAKKQCNSVIIDVPEDSEFTKFEVIKYVTGKMKSESMQDFGEVWVNYKGEWLYNPHKKKRG